MKYLLACFVVLILFAIPTSVNAQNQNVEISGLVVDSAMQPLAFSTVVLLQPEDSVLYRFGITNSNGVFIINKVKPGDYVLQISYMGFKNMAKMVSVKPQDKFSLGVLKLLENSQLVDEISVQGEHIPILFKKDTIEYNANAFKTKENAVVEDLLKRLPGVEVERDGSIKAQGEKVEKVLVDGKEFFGDNTAIATKNLPAKGVDKVQVFDKLSELAEFTGVDDGERTKTINLQMKDDHKKGYFGNVEGGYGPVDKYKARFNLNRFTDKMQLSFIGMGNNINEQGFSFEDYIGFMGGIQNLMSGGGSLMIDFDDLPMSMGMNTDKGLYKMYGGGSNINVDLSDNTRLIGNYFYNSINSDQKAERYQQSFLLDNSYTTTSQEDNKSDYGSHQLDLKLKHQIDTLQNMTLKFSLQKKSSEIVNLLNQQNSNVLGVNNSILSNEDITGRNMNYKSGLVYRRKFEKRGRSFVTNFSYSNKKDTSSSYLNSINDLVLLDTLEESFTTLVIQDQLKDNKSQNLIAGFTYTEPIGGKKYLKLKFSHRYDKIESRKDFYDINNSNERFLNPELSNNFVSEYTYDKTSFTYQYSSKKQFLNLSVGAQYTTLKGKEESETELNNNEYLNILPYLRYEYRFSSSNRLTASYNTLVVTPSIKQLQPVVDNNNSLSLFIGNPNLEPEFNHSANIHYMYYSSFSFTSLFTNVKIDYTTNKITNSVIIDSDLVQIVSPVNVEEDLTFSSYTSFNTPLKFIRCKINIDVNLRYNDGIVFLNGVRNDAQNWTKYINLSLENRKKKVFDIRGGIKFNHNTSVYSSNTEYDNLYMNYSSYFDFTVDFLKTWTVSSTFDYKTYIDNDFNTTDDFMLVNVGVSKTFLKDNKGELKLSIVDLLDQNKGLNRVNQLNYILEEKTNTLGRYFLISFTYSLSGYGK